MFKAACIGSFKFLRNQQLQFFSTSIASHTLGRRTNDVQ